uniref:Uncharacterized protein n=1 Tax=Tetranychus urticae TaxID=32264 RepID=T1KGL0_TETUR
MYPDAVISEYPDDLESVFHENLMLHNYTVKSYKLKVTYEIFSDFETDNCNIVKPKMAMQVNVKDQSSIKPAVDIHMSADIESEASKEPVGMSQEQQNIVNRDDDKLNMFFRCDNYSVSHGLDCQPTKWSLLYNLFEKLYDLGAKKVIFDGNLYCAHFDSAFAYQEAFERIRSCYLEHLEFVHASETQKQEVSMKMCLFYIPWCLNQELDLCCLMVKIESKHHADFIKTSKNILRNRECIFIKSVPGEIWIGFPDEIICENSKKTLLRVEAVTACCTRNNDVSMAKPSNELLKSIMSDDLVGDAYDLAFLSRLLKNSDSNDRHPPIIEQIRLQRMEEKECSEDTYHIEVRGYFFNKNSARFRSLSSRSQIAKIFVNLSKVIPLAITVMHDRAKLLYYSRYEAEFARHCINKLKTAEVPYFEVFHGVPGYVEEGLVLYWPEYYIINDQRKVLEKIVQNKNQVEELDSNSSKIQSTSDIDVLDEKVALKLKYILVITANSEFKFTSEMISIIKIHLLYYPLIEFANKIWVGFEDLGSVNRAKARIDKLKFKLLHENDEDDFDVGAVAKLVSNFPTKVVKMLANKLVDSTKKHKHMHTYWKRNYDDVSLGHFNYNYRKAVGMSTSQYFQSMELV